MKAKEFIKNLVDSGIPQTEIARNIGVTPGAITNYLYGKTEPTLDTIRKIARAYNVSLASLISDTPEEERSGYSYYLNDQGKMVEVPYGPAVCEKQPEYEPDIKAIVEMLKDDPKLARQVRRYTEFEKSASMEEIEDQTKVA